MSTVPFKSNEFDKLTNKNGLTITFRSYAKNHVTEICLIFEVLPTPMIEKTF